MGAQSGKIYSCAFTRDSALRKLFRLYHVRFDHARIFLILQIKWSFTLISCIVAAGISMHKGYAFVQFTNPFDARSACLGEDGRTVLSQILGE